MAEKLTYEITDDIARTTINRPEKMNCLDIETLESWIAALEEIATADVKLLTVRGAGGNLSAGADLAQVNSFIKEGDRERMETFLSLVHEVTGRIESLPMPSLAAVEGYTLAGGFEIMLACDLALASTEARIGDQHANYGLVAGGGGTQRVVDRLPKALANDLMFTGRHISGETAKKWGLVSRTTEPEEFDDALRSLEAELALKSRDAAKLTKSLMEIARETGGDVGMELERRRVVDHNFGADVREGLEAFEEGREPEF